MGKKVMSALLAAVLLLSAFGAVAAFAEEVKVPIILYHNIADVVPGEEYNALLNIPPDLFEVHMKALLQAGYTPITYGEYYEYVEHGAALPDKPILITFDDGYWSNYKYAYPVLKELGMKATIFVITDRRGKTLSKNPHFSWNQAKEMQDSGVIDIQSHTHSHEILTGLLDFDVYFELKTSKNLIEQKLGKKCSVLSFPQGIAGQREIQTAKYAGYLVLNKVGDQGVNRKEEGLDELKRISVRADYTGEKLVQVLQENMAY